VSPTLRVFLFGMLGSVAVEVVKVLSYYNEGGNFPARYRLWGFWIVRVLLGLIGGALAIAYGVQSDILAVHIGASTPAIIGEFARRLPGK
jgi:hypothetical protein